MEIAFCYALIFLSILTVHISTGIDMSINEFPDRGIGQTIPASPKMF